MTGTYKEGAVQLARGMDLIDVLRDVRGSLNADIDILLHGLLPRRLRRGLRRIGSCLVGCEAVEGLEQERPVDENLGMPECELEDVSLTQDQLDEDG